MRCAGLRAPSVSCKAVCPPPSPQVLRKKTFVCRRSRCIPSAILFWILDLMGVPRCGIGMYGACRCTCNSCVAHTRQPKLTPPADSTVPGLGVRVEDVHLYPILLLHYGLRDEDVDDGQGETNLRLDFSNTYRFEGVWSVAG